ARLWRGSPAGVSRFLWGRAPRLQAGAAPPGPRLLWSGGEFDGRFGVGSLGIASGLLASGGSRAACSADLGAWLSALGARPAVAGLVGSRVAFPLGPGPQAPAGGGAPDPRLLWFGGDSSGPLPGWLVGCRPASAAAP